MIWYRLARPPLPSFLKSAASKSAKILHYPLLLLHCALEKWTWFNCKVVDFELKLKKVEHLLILCFASPHFSALVWSSVGSSSTSHTANCDHSLDSIFLAHHEDRCWRIPRSSHPSEVWQHLAREIPGNVYHVGQWDEAKRWMNLITNWKMKVNNISTECR